MSGYYIRTFGCQMNKHDSERIAGLLAAEGLARASDPDDADVIVFNTCCVRDRAEERFRGQLASLSALKQRSPGPLIAVGGCVGQKDGAALLADFPHVDVVFGTHNLHELPDLLREVSAMGSNVAAVPDSSERFSSDSPARRDKPWHAWLPLMVGCDNHCTYCIVPRVRGAERSRSLEDVRAEAAALVADGVKEITLLGQNVNSFGRDRYGSPRFREALEVVAETGVDRIRFMTSHPKDLSDDVIHAMATIPAVCTHLHLPLQSGSTRILQAMGRSYSKKQYLELVGRLRDAMPDIALSTDVMVGFPGETEADFLETLDVISEAEFDQAFTFIYSPREGTPAAEMVGQVPREIAQDRFDRLVDAINAGVLDANRSLVGTSQRILVEGPSKRDERMLLGRTDTNKVVHALCPDDQDPSSLAGAFLDVAVEEAHTWFLMGTVRASHP